MFGKTKNGVEFLEYIKQTNFFLFFPPKKHSFSPLPLSLSIIFLSLLDKDYD